MEKTNKKHTEAEVREVCESIGFEYLGGYIGSDSTISIRLKCGHTIARRWRGVRRIAYGTYKTFECPECKAIKEKERQTEKDAEIRKKEMQRGLNLKAEQISFKFCEICGQPFVGRGATCDTECRRKRNNQVMERQKRIRTRKGWHRDNITWQMLFRKENGICYLCGKKCDPNDYQMINGAYVIGKNHPTVEHVIPISKGGADTIENCRLACLSCNSRKGAKVNAPYV